jgi:SAM-dependent methyltransferase
MTDATGPNAEQVRYWNDISGPKWVRFEALLDAQIGPLGRRAMDAAAVAPAERVLDVGCGCGDTTLELAGRVGPRGAVTGVDVSAVMLARAAERARAAGLVHVRFVNADAQTHALPPSAHDLVYSRFGVMFFTDPTAAFANLARTLRTGGRLAFVCWQAVQRNPWMMVPLAAAARHVTLPPPPGPDAPGPFSFADPERVRRILAGAGFIDVTLEPRHDTLVLGGGADLDATVEFLLHGVGPTSAALREAGAAAYPAVAVAVRAAVAPFAGPDGVRMESATWIVTARRP